MLYGTVDTEAPASSQEVSSSSQSHDLSRDAEDHNRTASRSHKMQQRLNAFYERNLGLFLVFLAQCGGSIVSLQAFRWNISPTVLTLVLDECGCEASCYWF